MGKKIKVSRALIKIERARVTLLEHLKTNGINFLSSPSHEELIKKTCEFLDTSIPVKRIQTRSHCAYWYSLIFDHLKITRNVLTPSQLKDVQALAKRHGAKLLNCIGTLDLNSPDTIVIIPKKKSPNKTTKKAVVPIESKPQKTSARSAADRKMRAFYRSYEWRQLRYILLTAFGPKCRACGKTPENGIVINMDHIQPIRRFWDLRLDPNNIQVMCDECNHGKSNWDQTDWRTLADKKLAKQIASTEFSKISLPPRKSN